MTHCNGRYIREGGTKRTAFIVAHRMSTIQNCDKIVYMKAGKVEAAGTYSDLMASSPEFAEFCDAFYQKGQNNDADDDTDGDAGGGDGGGGGGGYGDCARQRSSSSSNSRGASPGMSMISSSASSSSLSRPSSPPMISSSRRSASPELVRSDGKSPPHWNF